MPRKIRQSYPAIVTFLLTRSTTFPCLSKEAQEGFPAAPCTAVVSHLADRAYPRSLLHPLNVI